MNDIIGDTPYVDTDIIRPLSVLLADEIMLSIKIKDTYHYILRQNDFPELQLFFLRQSEKMDAIINDLRKFLYSQGFQAPGNMARILQLTHFNEVLPRLNTHNDFIRVLVYYHSILLDHLDKSESVTGGLPAKSKRPDFLTGITGYHQKMEWMMKLLYR